MSSEDREWINVTTLGGAFEEQMSACGRYWRHRPLDHGTLASLTGQSLEKGIEPQVELAWIPGRAPKSKP